MRVSELSVGLEPKLCKHSSPGLQALIASLSSSIILKTKYDACSPTLSTTQNQPLRPDLLQSASRSTPANSPTSKVWSHPSSRPSHRLPGEAPDSHDPDSAGPRELAHLGSPLQFLWGQTCPTPSAGKASAPPGPGPAPARWGMDATLSALSTGHPRAEEASCFCKGQRVDTAGSVSHTAVSTTRIRLGPWSPGPAGDNEEVIEINFIYRQTLTF